MLSTLGGFASRVRRYTGLTRQGVSRGEGMEDQPPHQEEAVVADIALSDSTTNNSGVQPVIVYSEHRNPEVPQENQDDDSVIQPDAIPSYESTNVNNEVQTVAVKREEDGGVQPVVIKREEGADPTGDVDVKREEDAGPSSDSTTNSYAAQPVTIKREEDADPSDVSTTNNCGAPQWLFEREQSPVARSNIREGWQGNQDNTSDVQPDVVQRGGSTDSNSGGQSVVVKREELPEEDGRQGNQDYTSAVRSDVVPSISTATHAGGAQQGQSPLRPGLVPNRPHATAQVAVLIPANTIHPLAPNKREDEAQSMEGSVLQEAAHTEESTTETTAAVAAVSPTKSTAHPTASEQKSEKYLKRTNPSCKGTNQVGLKAGDRLEVAWELEDDTSGERKKKWWGCTLQEHDGRTQYGLAIRVLDYDPFPAGGFPEHAQQEVLFLNYDMFTSHDGQDEFEFRLEGELGAANEIDIVPNLFEIKETDPYIVPEAGDLVSFQYHPNQYRLGVVCSPIKTASKPEYRKVRFFLGNENGQPSFVKINVYITRDWFDKGQFRARPELRPHCRCYDTKQRAFCILKTINMSCGSVSVLFDGDQENTEISPDFLVFVAPPEADGASLCPADDNREPEATLQSQDILAEFSNSTGHPTARQQNSEKYLKRTNPRCKRTNQVGLTAGDRLEVAWELEDDTSRERKKKWWGCTLQEHDGRTQYGLAIRVLDYDPFPAGGFPEQTKQEVVFLNYDLFTSRDGQDGFEFRLEGQPHQLDNAAAPSEPDTDEKLARRLQDEENKNNSLKRTLRSAAEVSSSRKTSTKRASAARHSRSNHSLCGAASKAEVAPNLFEIKESDAYIVPKAGELISFQYHPNQYFVGVVSGGSPKKKGSKAEHRKVRFFFGNENGQPSVVEINVYITRDWFDRGQFRARPELKLHCRCYDAKHRSFCILKMINMSCGSVSVLFDGEQENTEISPDFLVLVAPPEAEGVRLSPADNDREAEAMQQTEVDAHDPHFIDVEHSRESLQQNMVRGEADGALQSPVKNKRDPEPTQQSEHTAHDPNYVAVECSGESLQQNMVRGEADGALQSHFINNREPEPTQQSEDTVYDPNSMDVEYTRESLQQNMVRREADGAAQSAAANNREPEAMHQQSKESACDPDSGDAGNSRESLQQNMVQGQPNVVQSGTYKRGNEITPEAPKPKRRRIKKGKKKEKRKEEDLSKLPEAPRVEAPPGYMGTLAQSNLQRSVGLTRALLTQHQQELGLTAKSGQQVFSLKDGKLSHLTFNSGWNVLPYTEDQTLKFWLGEGPVRLKQASSVDPANNPDHPAFPVFWAQPSKKKGGQLCHYIGHFRCIHFDTSQKAKLKNEPRQALLEFKFVEFKVEIAERMQIIANINDAPAEREER